MSCHRLDFIQQLTGKLRKRCKHESHMITDLSGMSV